MSRIDEIRERAASGDLVRGDCHYLLQRLDEAERLLKMVGAEVDANVRRSCAWCYEPDEHHSCCELAAYLAAGKGDDDARTPCE